MNQLREATVATQAKPSAAIPKAFFERETKKAGGPLLTVEHNACLAGGPLQQGAITRVCLLTWTEITRGAPLLAFEKWPGERRTPLGSEHPALISRLTCRVTIEIDQS